MYYLINLQKRTVDNYYINLVDDEPFQFNLSKISKKTMNSISRINNENNSFIV